MTPGRPSKIDAQYPDEERLAVAVQQYGVAKLATRIGCDPSAIYKRLRGRYGLRVETRLTTSRQLVKVDDTPTSGAGTDRKTFA